MISFANMGFSAMTPLSSFNSLVLSLEGFRSGEMEKEVLAQEFALFQNELAQIGAVFRWEAPFQESSWQPAIRAALLELERSENEAFLLSEAVESGGFEGLALEPMGQALVRLFEQFAVLRQKEEERPKLSPSAPINELLRCCDMYDAQQLEAALLEARLDSVLVHFRGLSERLQNQPLRHPTVDKVLEILEIQDEVLQSLLGAVSQGTRPLDDETLEALEECALEAFEQHGALLALQGQPTRWCQVCQGLVLVAAEAEVCEFCGEPLLVQEDGKVLPSHLQALVGCVLAIGHKPDEAAWRQLGREVQASLQRVASGRIQWEQSLKTLSEAPPVDLSPPLERFESLLLALQPAVEANDCLLVLSLSDEVVEACHQLTEAYAQMQQWVEQNAKPS